MDPRLDNYLEQNRERHLDELFAFLRIPSVSQLSRHQQDIRECAEWTARQLEAAGMEHIEIIATDGNPVVYGDWLHAKEKPTVLIYGHYDVQPAEPLDLWDSPPFEPEIRDGNIFARGATDDKSQVFMHIKAAEAFINAVGTLPVNIKFCLEGEEEIGSPHLPRLLEERSGQFEADAVVLSDSDLYEKGHPAILNGLRGLCALQVEVIGARSDLHSGEFGGGVPNPIHVLAELIASLHKADGRVAVEEFYENVKPLSEEDKAAFRALGFDEEKLKIELGLRDLFGESGFGFLERTWGRPALEINAMGGGLQDEGLKSIVPAKAWAKISCRLVPDQQPDEILQLVEDHLRRRAPDYVEVRLIRLPIKGNPFVAPLDHPYIAAAAKAYESVYGVPTVYKRTGGSIPIVEVCARLMKAPVVMMGFGLPDENLHAPNEHFHLENYDKGLRVLCRYWDELGK